MSPTQIFIVQAKLAPDVAESLYALIERHARELDISLSSDPQSADIIITSIRMKKRLERHIPSHIAHRKPVVSPQWLYDSIRQQRQLPCSDYIAIPELQHGSQRSSVSPSLSEQSISPRTSADIEEVLPPTSEHVKSNIASRYACTRASPLTCPNQRLLEQLDVLYHSREFEGKNVNSLAYERAISVLKAYPRVITPKNFGKEVIKLPFLGEKLRAKIKEYMKTGTVKESEEIRASQWYQSMCAFTSVYGVGPSTARKLYDLGLRTIDDMMRYYDVVPGSPENAPGRPTEIFTPNGRPVPAKTRAPDMTIKLALTLRDDLTKTIPRCEVEEIHRVVMANIAAIQPGCISTIVGGYRRGKSDSNDVDIVISHSDLEHGEEYIKELCPKVVERLYHLGLVTNVMYLSGFHAHNALREAHRDSLEKALTIFKLPDNGDDVHCYRRVDLIFAAPEAYWTAVVGWQTGSKMFERDLRLWAKNEKGMKFDSSGLTRRRDSKRYIPRSEQEVFDILGLEWIEPTLRNANV